MKNAAKIVHPDTIRFERLMPGSPSRIWEYLTVPELLSTWLADAKLNAREGGEIELHKKDGIVVNGVINQFVPPRTLSYSWKKNSTVTFELKTLDDIVQLVLTHKGLPLLQVPTICAGWHTHLEILFALLQDQKPESFPLLFEHFLRSYKQHLQLEMGKEHKKASSGNKERRRIARGSDFV